MRKARGSNREDLIKKTRKKIARKVGRCEGVMGKVGEGSEEGGGRGGRKN